MTKIKQYSITSAKNALRLFFSDGHSTTPQAIFQLSDRAGKSPESNTGYLYNKLTILRHFGLIDTDKESDDEGVTRIVKIKLTHAGKELLSSSVSTEGPPTPPANTTGQITLQSITDAVDEFNRQNPSWEIELVPKRVKKET